jgi:predicted nucleotidyltransferase
MNKLFELKFGSHLYGTDTPTSDTDLKSVYLPESRQIVLGNYPKTISTSRPKAEFERNNKDDIDLEIFSLDRYLKLLAEGQTVALELLFAPMSSYTYVNQEDYHVFSGIYSNRYELLHKDITPIIGYARQQASKYGLKGFRVAALRDTLDFLNTFTNTHERLNTEENLPKVMKFVYKRPCANPVPKNEHITIEHKLDKAGRNIPYLKVCDKYYELTCRIKDAKERVQKKFDEYGRRALLAEKNEGVDWKAISHCVRVINQGIELLETGNLEFPRPDRALQLKIKTGQLPYKECEEIILQGFQDLKVAQEKSTLREAPNQEWIDNYLEEVYTGIVKGTLYD